MLNRELGLFILNGIISVMLAFVVYWMLVFDAGLDISVSTGAAYVVGMSYGFFANKALSFQDRGRITATKVIRYVLLYLFTLVLNISINVTVLETFRLGDFAVFIAFMVAVSISTVLNFLGLKYLVFASTNGLSIPSSSVRTRSP